MASGRHSARLHQTALCLLLFVVEAQLIVEAHTEVAAVFPSWLRQRELKQIGQQTTVPSLPPRACATITPHISIIQAALNATSAKAEQLKHSPGIESASALVTINVYCHIISTGPNLGDGNVPDQWVAAQMNTMNKAYIATGFQFALVNISRTVNAGWYNMAPQSSEEVAAKTLLRSGNMRDLNLYINAGGGYGLLGWTYYPFQSAGVLDSSTIYWNSMPGGSAGGGEYGLGMSAVHEVGHWLGLFHTFQGGCPSPGDFVSDTASEGSASYGCTPRDTCLGDGMADPINNFMDYSNDACMTTFTPGQAARMTDMWHTYRAIAPALPTGSVLLSSPSSVAAIAASASAVANSNQKTHPAPKPTSPRPKPIAKPTPKPRPKPSASKPQSSGSTVLPNYAQCGGIAGSPVCSPHCTDAAWSSTRCSSGKCRRSSGWYWQCVP